MQQEKKAKEKKHMTECYVNEKKGLVIVTRKNKHISVKSKAKCNSKDTFDEATGKKLATLRAEKKFHNARKVYFAKKAKSLHAQAEAYRGFEKATHAEYEKTKQELETLLASIKN